MKKYEPFRSLEGTREEEQWSSSDVRCPHCEGTMNIHDDDLVALYQEGLHSVDCAHCDKVFEVQTNVSYRFTSPPLAANNRGAR